MTREALLRATVTALGMHSLVGGGVDTGLGWMAKQKYLAYDAGTVLATAENSSRPRYSKTNRGFAICQIVENANDGQYGGDWCYALLISTDRAAAAVTGYQPGIYTLQYLGLTWYIGGAGQNADWGGATTLNTTFPKVDAGGARISVINSTAYFSPEFFAEIMQAAGVRLGEGGGGPRPVLAAGR